MSRFSWLRFGRAKGTMPHSRLRLRLAFVLVAVAATRLLIGITDLGSSKARYLKKKSFIRDAVKPCNPCHPEKVERVLTGKLPRKIQRTDSEALSNCYDDEIDWKDGTQPKYKMNPDLLLIPSLYNGPNNQLIGFQQSVLVALILNRTLVLPQFYEHAMIGVVYRGVVNAKYRLDVQRLREFISVIPLDEAVEACDKKIDAIFATEPWQKKKNAAKLVRLSMELGLKTVKYAQNLEDGMLDALRRFLYNGEDIDDENILSQPWWPRSRTDTEWITRVLDTRNPAPLPVYPKGQDQSTDLPDLKTAYNSKDKCALYWRPFRQYHFKPSDDDINAPVDRIHSLHNVTMKNGGELYMDILRHFRPPPSIRGFCDEFRSKYLAENYIALHWRYDEEDFFDYLCKDRKKRSKFCDEVRTTSNATALSMAVLQKLKDITDDTGEVVTAVYFAAPPSLDKLVNSVKTILKNYLQFQRHSEKSNKMKAPNIYSAVDLKRFLFQKHGNCDWVKGKRLSDTISQVEMDLCVQSTAFLFSRQSTWSGNVRFRRKTMKELKSHSRDASITDFTLKVMKYPT